MTQELLDLIHLNTYVDYSANQATDEDIDVVKSRRRFKLDEDHVDFLRQLNGFKVYDLNIYGSKSQDDLKVEDVWYNNDQFYDEKPKLREYFIIGHCSDAFYAYHPEQKKYCTLEFTNEDSPAGRDFENLDELLEWAVKRSAKRVDEQVKIIYKKALLHVPNQITSFLEAHGFQLDHGNILLNSGYLYVRTTPQATEQLWTSFRINPLRNKLSLTISVFKRYNLIETFFETEYMKKAKFRDDRNFTVMLYEDLPEYQSEFSEHELNDNYESITATLISFIETYIFRAFALYDNVKILDAKVNESLDGIGNLYKGNAHFFLKMIIAKLALNPRYDKIFKSVEERYEKVNLEFLNLTLLLNDDLQNTLPPKDGMLV